MSEMDIAASYCNCSSRFILYVIDLSSIVKELTDNLAALLMTVNAPFGSNNTMVTFAAGIAANIEYLVIDPLIFLFNSLICLLSGLSLLYDCKRATAFKWVIR